MIAKDWRNSLASEMRSLLPFSEDASDPQNTNDNGKTSDIALICYSQ